jgi:transposase-like protein
LRAI